VSSPRGFLGRRRCDGSAGVLQLSRLAMEGVDRWIPLRRERRPFARPPAERVVRGQAHPALSSS